MKYIDTEKLKAEIERRRLSNRYIDTEGYEAELFKIIDSLPQEQSVVNLEKEIEKALDNLTTKDLRGWFRYFYEIGLKIGKEE